MSKKDYGKAISAILSTITETYCCVGENDISSILNLLNAANHMAIIWDLKENEDIENYKNSFNQILHGDDSKYRIIYEDFTYKLVTIA